MKGSNHFKVHDLGPPRTGRCQAGTGLFAALAGSTVSGKGAWAARRGSARPEAAPHVYVTERQALHPILSVAIDDFHRKSLSSPTL